MAKAVKKSAMTVISNPKVIGSEEPNIEELGDEIVEVIGTGESYLADGEEGLMSAKNADRAERQGWVKIKK